MLTTILKISKTRLNYWAEFAIDIPLGVLLVFAALHHGEFHLIAVILIILLGLFLFSLFEYSIHRWLFHGTVQIMVQSHWAHHENPLGYDSLPFFLPALILLAITGIFDLFMAREYAFLLAATLAFGYVTYGLSHFAIHHHHFHRLLARNWAANHHIHHYHAESNFGVTTPLWDLLLGTHYVYDHKRS